MEDAQNIHKVDPARLAGGVWDHENERESGEGDISAAYSADLIAFQGRIRKPFNYAGQLWVTTGKNCRGEHVTAAEASRLIPREHFNGAATTYAEKVRIEGGELARNDPNGFYHGMTVQQGGQTLVIIGPPALFVPGDPAPQQLGLF